MQLPGQQHLPDQWAFLSAISRIDRSAVEAIVRNAEASDRIVGVRPAPAEEDESEPWTTLPSRRGREYPIGGPFAGESGAGFSGRNLRCERCSFAGFA